MLENIPEETPRSPRSSRSPRSPRGEGSKRSGRKGSRKNRGASKRRNDPKGDKTEKKKKDEEWLTPLKTQLTALVQGRVFQGKDFKYGDCIGKGSMAAVRLVLNRHQQKQDQPLPMVMKIMSKHQVVQLGQAERIKQEKSIWQTLDSPFVAGYLTSFQDERRLCLLLEFVHGGDLYNRLKKEGRLPVDQCKFYSAELCLALEYLHTSCVLYRDLKPDNILLDREGHIKLTDFGFAKRLEPSGVTYSIVGTPEYLPPEIITSAGHTHSCDYWSLGIVMFEMLCGYPPFFDDSPYQIYTKIMANDLKYPRHFDVKARHLLLKGLLVAAEQRYGAMDTMKHKWFDYVDWDLMMERGLQAPFKPTVRSPLDTGMFEIVPDNEAMDRFQDHEPIMKKQNAPFVDFF